VNFSHQQGDNEMSRVKGVFYPSPQRQQGPPSLALRAAESPCHTTSRQPIESGLIILIKTVDNNPSPHNNSELYSYLGRHAASLH
jgi:hypothetical protein